MGTMASGTDDQGSLFPQGIAMGEGLDTQVPFFQNYN